MSDGKRRKDNNRAALNKCWTEDIEWELIPNTLREVSAGNDKGGGTFSVSCAFSDHVFSASAHFVWLAVLIDNVLESSIAILFFAHRTFMLR